MIGHEGVWGMSFGYRNLKPMFGSKITKKDKKKKKNVQRKLNKIKISKKFVHFYII